MLKHTPSLFLLVSVGLAACASVSTATNDDADQVISLNQLDAQNQTAAEPTPCSAYEFDNWTAVIQRAEDNNDGFELVLSGEVILPTPGYGVEWSLGISDRAMPPLQNVHMSFKPPAGMVVQMLSEETIDGRIPVPYPEYRSIVLHCGDQIVAQFDDIKLRE